MEERLFYSIGEVSDMLNIPMSTLRFWEKEFPFTEPKKNDKGTRFYTKKEIENIQLVQYLLKEKKLTIEGAKEALKSDKDKTERTHAIVQKLKKIQSEIHALKLAFNETLQITEEDEAGEEEQTTNSNTTI